LKILKLNLFIFLSIRKFSTLHNIILYANIVSCNKKFYGNMGMFLKYYKKHLFYNLIVSVVLCLYCLGAGPVQLCLKTGLPGLKANYSFFIITVFFAFNFLGFLISLFIIRQLHYREFYFYFNAALSEKHLAVYSFFSNIFLFVSAAYLLKEGGII
jgi:hypothetical protein